MKLQKILMNCLLVAAVALVGIFLLPTDAQAATSGYYTYVVSDGEATITYCSSSISGNVTIPSTLGGYPVTSIGSEAFYDCSSLTSITIPEGVTSIDFEAFSYCSSLTSITIPESVTTIGEAAFIGCSSLEGIWVATGNENYASDDRGVLFNKNKTELIQAPSAILGNYVIPESVTSIGSEAFSYCSSLTSITIPEGVTTIGGNAFSVCDSLKRIAIPESVTTIGEFAFIWCSSLEGIWVATGNENYASDDRGVLFNKNKTELIQAPGAILGNYVIPESVTSIGGFAFSGCSSLTSITIPECVTSIERGVFYNCSSLTSITIPECVTSIEWGVFYNCSSLESITLPEGVTSIGEYAFYDCSNLTSITIPEGVTRIRWSTFYNCSSLESITLPEGVTSIGDDAFSYCSSLASITLPEGVTSIGYNVFSYCSSLESITLPEGVTSIGERAFYGCSSLKNVYYAANSARWNRIQIGKDNYHLTNARIHYNHIHDYSVSTVAATCAENGYVVHTCVCGDAYNVVIPAIGHSYVDDVCANCGVSNLADFTGDGEVTDADAIYLLRHILFPDNFPISGNADVNGDGELTDADAIYLLRHTLFPGAFPLYPNKKKA